MATFLSKFFKPKWQNKHLPTRIEAIEALNTSSEEEQAILLSIAQEDSHIDARTAAVNKLDQSTQLISLHQKAKADTQQVIEQRLYELANAQSLTIYDLIPDTKLLTEMIVKSDQPDTFIRGLAHIEDPQALLTIAQSSKTSKIRQAAAELLETEEQLQTLSQSAKSKDKSVYQIVKNKLGKLREIQKSQQATQTTISSLLEALEDHAKTDNLKHYEAKLSSLLQRWESVQAQANNEQEQRFDNAYETSKNRLLTMQREQQAEAEQTRLIQAGGDEQNATLLTLQDTLDQFREKAASFQEIAALDAIIKTQETRWLEATRHDKVEKTKNKHYQTLMTTLRQYHGALKAASEHSSTIQDRIKDIEHNKKDPKKLSESIDALNRVIKKIDWPNSYCQPELLEKATQALGHSADVKAQLVKNAQEAQAKIQQLIGKLDQSLEDRQIKQSNKIYKDIQNLVSQIDAKHAEKIHNQLVLRVNQLNDLRDWQGYASTPRQTELCEAMERLAEQHIEPQDKAERIKAMQKEWKTLGGAAEKELWDRFKTAADKAYEPCKMFFDEQTRLKTANIERRKTLILQLKEFIDNNDWNQPDWKLAEQINRKARTDWKDAYPIDFKANKPLQAEFNALLDTLDSHLGEERGKNEAQKAAIVEQALALVEEADLEKAINGAKALQQEWKAIGITDHRKDRKHWKAFRAACDKIFERRDQNRAERKEQSEASIQAFETFCAELETFSANTDGKSVAELEAALADFRKQFKQQEALPRNKQEALFKRFEEGIKQLKQAIQKLENQAYLDSLSNMQACAKLCREANANTDSDLDEMDEAFNAITLPAPIANTFKSLWISVKAKSVASEYLIDADEARNLCIRCEIAAGIDSPETDTERRMQLQVSRLSEGMSSSNEHASREDQLKAMLQGWYTKVSTHADDLNQFEPRIEKAIAHLFG